MLDPTIEQAWATFHTPLLQFVQRRVANTAVAEDIVQDVFLKAHTHIATVSDTAKLQSWLYQIARNAIIDHYRSARATVDVPANIPAFACEQENDAAQRLTSSVSAMVAALPSMYREALLLTEYEGLSQKQLAHKLGLSLSGAKSRVQRARRMVKHMLLDCCDFEFDQRGAILSYRSRQTCCINADC